mmetsp:Transcript_10658/g.24312  ORF Transcript_10658/g.24312 Transcript_10658/m.24312 type:complete len:490 (-) Transcript_10658:177-1646(-)
METQLYWEASYSCEPSGWGAAEKNFSYSGDDLLNAQSRASPNRIGAEERLSGAATPNKELSKHLPTVSPTNSSLSKAFGGSTFAVKPEGGRPGGSLAPPALTSSPALSLSGMMSGMPIRPNVVMMEPGRGLTNPGPGQNVRGPSPQEGQFRNGPSPPTGFLPEVSARPRVEELADQLANTYLEQHYNTPMGNAPLQTQMLHQTQQGMLNIPDLLSQQYLQGQFRQNWPQMPEMPPKGFKTVICKFWENNMCAKGANCTFAHGLEELRRYTNAASLNNGLMASSPLKMERFKTKLCLFHMQGRCCKGPSCPYAHGLQELRPFSSASPNQLDCFPPSMLTPEMLMNNSMFAGNQMKPNIPFGNGGNMQEQSLNEEEPLFSSVDDQTEGGQGVQSTINEDGDLDAAQRAAALRYFQNQQMMLAMQQQSLQMQHLQLQAKELQGYQYMNGVGPDPNMQCSNGLGVRMANFPFVQTAATMNGSWPQGPFLPDDV